MGLKVFLVLFVLVLSCYLFYKASGTLAINKLNIISYMFYLFLLQAFLGGSLIFLGFRNHYLTKKIVHIATIDKTFYFIAYTAIAFPLIIILISLLLKVDVKKKYDEYLKTKVIIEDEKYMFYIISGISAVCILCGAYMFLKMGRIPLLDIIFGRGANIGEIRGELSGKRIMNPYIQNLFVLNLIPVLSYIALTYAMTKKDIKWISLSIVLFGSSILVKTYNYAKSPVVFYIGILVLLFIIVNGKISIKRILTAGIACTAIMVLMYVRSGYDFSKGIEIYNGPIARTIFTQVGTLFLHFDAFPKFLPFLAGRSFSPTILNIFFGGMNHIRSGKVVMELYSPYNVYHGTAGVMNSLFVGEAYANFGEIGAIISPLYVGAVIGIMFLLVIKSKKTPINIAIYISLTALFTTAFQGGFTDFVYNFTTIFLLCALFGIKIFYKLLIKILKK